MLNSYRECIEKLQNDNDAGFLTDYRICAATDEEPFDAIASCANEVSACLKYGYTPIGSLSILVIDHDPYGRYLVAQAVFKTLGELGAK